MARHQRNQCDPRSLSLCSRERLHLINVTNRKEKVLADPSIVGVVVYVQQPCLEGEHNHEAHEVNDELDAKTQDVGTPSCPSNTSPLLTRIVLIMNPYG